MVSNIVRAEDLSLPSASPYAEWGAGLPFEAFTSFAKLRWEGEVGRSKKLLKKRLAKV
jgi:hypothetical protein